MFRIVGKALRELWVACIAILFCIADWNNVFDGSWIGVAGDWLTLLIVGWLILFAIGVSRGEPNP